MEAFEMTKRPVIVDQRQADLRRIDVEIERLERQIADKEAALDADARKHLAEMDHNLQQRLGQQIVALRSHVKTLHDDRFSVELGDITEPGNKPAAVAAAPVKHQAWDIDEKVLTAGQPAYPGVVRGSADDDGKVFPEAWVNMKAFWEASCMDHFRKADIPADFPVNMDFAASMNGEIMATHIWLSARCKALEARLAEIESRPQLEYRGVWKSTDAYKRGDLTTYDGSMWHAQVGSQGLVPGQGEGWRLCVKKGKDARS
ncbi:hypothetical protein EOA13_31380 [Mesorhizobium sp. M7A.F.Ca.US.011.01.1.1]|uniref:hypothetical protein n=1 Tax=Mesorhizobium sp. M7A.F.Ca.US.011.01.1.1 TaxID=2496741 RepID=UPI000FCB1F32|nr:hypothetical protein [Mesorhizobium sp. M7A.F.Ca.US.011.01.1.1]RUX24197.1 hypothetical protein EOA13_31380 [Mesorhizobium sp. M7A.F.Ca.US.011.01.1.1]